MKQQVYRRGWLFFLLTLGLLLTAVAVALLYLQGWLYDTSGPVQTQLHTETVDASQANSFPVGVDPRTKIITESPLLASYVSEHLFADSPSSRTVSFIDRALFKITALTWVQNVASPSTRIGIILPGQRQEEVTKHFGDILDWNEDQRALFELLIAETVPHLPNGKLYPGRYALYKDATPTTVAQAILDRFDREVVDRYPANINAIVPLGDTLTLASLLEREAYDFSDMREISGILWNRLFINMNLQVDATLQYAKGETDTKTWWPVPTPPDKYIDSPYNTYQHNGLPPTPISSVAANAIVAALNPKPTTCLFYFHDADGNFHCSDTYEGHVTLLKQYYGRGR